MANVIQTLGPDSYVGFMEFIGDGNDASTHKALVRFNGSEEAIDSYVKVYCRQKAPKGLANELIGYALAKWGGLLTPTRAAVLLLDDVQAKCLPAAIDPIQTRDGYVIAWCVQSLGGRTPKQSYNLASDKLAAIDSIQQDLKKWKELPDVTTLDAWVLNEDRNLGNLVRVGVGKYALIDHGRVCTGNSWAAPLERSRMKHRNVLAEIAWKDPDLDNAPSSLHSPLVASFDRHQQALQDAAIELEYWLPILISEKDKDEATEFLEERVSSVREYLSHTFGLLTL